MRLAPSLDKYKDRVLFPKLLEKANAMLRLGGLPKLPGKGSDPWSLPLWNCFYFLAITTILNYYRY